MADIVLLAHSAGQVFLGMLGFFILLSKIANEDGEEEYSPPPVLLLPVSVLTLVTGFWCMGKVVINSTSATIYLALILIFMVFMVTVTSVVLAAYIKIADRKLRALVWVQIVSLATLITLFLAHPALTILPA